MSRLFGCDDLNCPACDPDSEAGMTSPTMARTEATGDRWYTDDLPGMPEVVVPSVTTVLTALPKHALVKWAASETAKAAWARRTIVASAPENDQDVWISNLKGAPWEKRDGAADRGTAVHLVMEQLINGEEPAEYGEELWPWMTAGRQFLAERKPEKIWTETTVFSRTHGYAGSFDLLAYMPGYGLSLMDYKTGKDAYGDYALQLAAYRFADYAIVGGKRAKMPKIDSCLIVLLNERGYKVVPVRAGRSQLMFFLACKQVWEFQRLSRTLLQKDWYGQFGAGGEELTGDAAAGYLAMFTSWLRDKIMTYTPEMATELAADWPPVPTFRWARENNYLFPHHELVIIESAMVKVEARHGHQFALTERPEWWLPCRVCGEPCSVPDTKNPALRVHPACEADPMGVVKRIAEDKAAKRKTAATPTPTGAEPKKASARKPKKATA